MKMTVRKRKFLKAAIVTLLSAGMVVGMSGTALAGTETGKGEGAKASKAYSVAYGYHTYAKAGHASAVGAYANACNYNSVALGYSTTTSRDSEVDVGWRTLGQLKDATEDDQAVTYGQFKSTKIKLGQVFTLTSVNPTANIVNEKDESLAKITISQGSVASGNTGFIVGDTMYIELRAPIAGEYDGSKFAKYKGQNTPYISATNTTGKNLTNLAWEVKDLDDHFEWDDDQQWIWGGFANTVAGASASAYGTKNTVNGQGATAVGNNNKAYSTSATAIGTSNTAGNEKDTKVQNSTALGSGNTASANQSSAYGYKNSATGTYATAVGNTNLATGSGSSAYGYISKALANNATAIGSGAQAVLDNATAVGYNSYANKNNSTAVGSGNKANGIGSSAYGLGNTADGANATAIGSGSSASAASTTAVGASASATVANATAVGSSSQATAASAAVYGYNSAASGESSIAIGNTAAASKVSAIAIGTNASAGADNAVAIGQGSSAAGNNSVAIGQGSATLATQSNVVSVGTTKSTRRIVNVTAGTVNTDAANYSQIAATGQGHAFNSTENAASITTNAGVTIAQLSIDVGAIEEGDVGFVDGGTVYEYLNSHTFGIVDYDTAYKDTENYWLSTDFGTTDVTHGLNSAAYGYGANASAENAVAIGTNAKATAQNAIAIGADSVADAENVFSVGSSTTQRKIVNVAAGGANTDAANYGQILAKADVTISAKTNSATLKDNAGNDLITITVNDLGGKDGSSSVVEYSTEKHWLSTDFDKTFTTKGDNSTAYGYGANAQAENSVAIGTNATASAKNAIAIGSGSAATVADTFSVGSSGNERTIVNVKTGTNNTDAANVGQIAKANQYIDATNNKIYANDGTTVIATITGLGGSGSGSGSGIVDYDLSYEAADEAGAGGAHWLSTDFGKKNSVTHGKDSAAYGYGANAKGNESVAIGKNAVADGDDSIAIGSDSVAHTGDDGVSEISFGHAAADTNPETGMEYGTELKRRLANVASGTKSGDVATWDQLVEEGQTLYASTESREDDGEKNKNVLYDNAGKALAMMSIGSVKEGNTGFVSGGAVWSAGVAKKQTITGEDNVIKNNADEDLVTIKVASASDTKGDGFVTKSYFDENTTKIVSKNSIVDFDTKYGTTEGDHWLSTDFGNAASKDHGADSVAYGYNASASGAQSVAIGKGARATNVGSVAIGDSALVTGSGSIAIGQNSSTYEENVVSFGSDSLQRRLTNVEDGQKSSDAATYGQIAQTEQPVSLRTTDAPGEGDTDVRTNVLRTNDGDILAVLEKGTVANGNTGFVSGGDVFAADVKTGQTLSAKDTAIVNNSGKSLVTIKVASDDDTDGDGFVTKKYYTDTINNYLALNSIVNFDQNYGTADGDHWLSTDFGKTATTTHGKDSAAYGYGANASADNSVAIGSGSVANVANTFSVGSTTSQRKIVNVADGTNKTDAATWGQIVAKQTIELSASANSADIVDNAGNQVVSIIVNGLGGSSGESSIVKYSAGTLTAKNWIATETDSGSEHAENSTAYGIGASADAVNSVAIGYGSIASDDGVFSIGGMESETQITDKEGRLGYTYIPTGKGEAEGVTVYKDASTSTYYDEEGNVTSVDLTAGSLSAATETTAMTRRIINVANGEENTDAATYGQLAEKGQNITQTNNKIYDNQGNVIATIEGLSGDGGSIVKYDPDYASDEGSHSHWLSTDFDKSDVTHGEDSAAYGYGANARGDESVAIGKNAVAQGEGSIAIGSGSVAKTGDDGVSEISFGHAEGDANPAGGTYDSDLKRRLANVASGTKSGDVATWDQLVAESQTLYASTELRDGDTTKKQNVLYNNNGDALATLTIGSVTEGSTGFVSGGDVWAAVAAQNQQVTLSTASRDETDATKGHGNEIVTNDGKVLATFKVADATKPDEENADAFITNEYLNTKIEEKSIVDYDANYGTAEGDHWLSTDFGTASVTHGKDSTAYGYGANAIGDASVAIGKNAKAQNAGSVALGAGATAFADGAVAIGQGSEVTTANVVSFGSSSLKRKLTNVEAGTTSNDAATYGQIADKNQTISLQSTKAPAAGETDKRTNVLKSNSGDILAVLEKGTVSEDNTGFISGGDVYDELHLEKDGTYVKQDYTTGANLLALDTQVRINTTDIIGLKDMSNLTDTGKINVRKIAGQAVVVQSANSSTVVTSKYNEDTGVTTYSIATGDSVAGGGQKPSRLRSLSSSARTGSLLTSDISTMYDLDPDRTTKYAVWQNYVEEGSNYGIEYGGDNSVALGYASAATGGKATAIGDDSIASANYSVALGADSVATEAGEVSFGHEVGDYDRRATNGGTVVKYTSALTRRLTNVSAGYNDTDVVNFSQVKVEAPTYTGANAGTTYLTSSATTDHDGTITLNAEGTVGKNLAALDAKAVKSSQNLAFSSSEASQTLYANDGTALATISVTGLNDSKPIVDYDSDYATSGDHWLSTDFGKESVSHGKDSAAYGYGANAKAAESVAIGKNAYADGEGSIAIGADSVAHTTQDKDRNNIEEISFGHAKGDTAADGTEYSDDLKRKLTNVAYGTDDNDVATVGQIVAAGQNVTLSTNARNASDATKGKGNEIVANDGTVLATFTKGSVTSGDTNFVSGGDVYAADVASKEVNLSTTTNGNKVYTNGNSTTPLLTFTGMTNVATDDFGFVSGANLYDETRDDITDTNYLSKESTTGANLNALANKIGTPTAVDGLYEANASLETKISKVAEASIEGNQEISLTTTTKPEAGDDNRTNVLKANDGTVLATFTAGTVEQSNNGFVSGGQVWAADVASKTVDLSTTTNGNKVYTNGNSTTPLLTFTGMTNVATDDYGFVSGANLFAETRAAISTTKKDTYISQKNTTGANLSALDNKAIYKQEAAVDEDGNVVIYSNDGTGLITITGVQGMDTDTASGGLPTRVKALRSVSFLSAANSISPVSLGDGLQANDIALAAEETPKYSDDIVNDIFTFGTKGSSDDTIKAGAFTNTKNKSQSAVRNDAHGEYGVAYGGLLNVAAGTRSATYGYATYAGGENSAAFGAGSVANDANEVSFGHEAGDIDLDSMYYDKKLVTFTDSLTRRLTNVSAGYKDTDVTNFSQIKTVAPTYTAANAGTTYLTSSLTEAGALNEEGTVGKNLAALDAKAVKEGQSLAFSSTSKSGTLYANDGTALATISVTGLGEESGKGSSIVDYDPDYAKASTESEKHSGWLSTDFNKSDVEHGADSTAYGYGANAKGDESVAIGKNAYADGEGSIAIGADSVAHTTTDKDGNKIEEISFGHTKDDIDPSTITATNPTGTAYGTDLKRKLTNVAYGTDNNDVATVGQIVAGDQTISLATTTKPETGDDTRTNVLKANDGTVLATFTAGAVEKDNTGFISGGDAWKSDMAPNQTLSASSTTLYANDGTTALATIKVADPDDPTADDDAFVTKKYYNQTINNIIDENSIVDYDPDYAKSGDHWLSTDFGKENVEHGKDSTAYGYGANAKGDDSVAIGNGATATDTGSVAIGDGATAEDGSVAIGDGAKAVENSVAIGKDSVAYGENEISFGHSSEDIDPATGNKYGNDLKRKLTNVEYGTDDNDVATYGQIVADGQSVKLSSDARNKDNAKDGKYNELVANDGTVLATFESAKVASGDTGFVSGGDLYSEVRPTDGTYVKSAQTTAANLAALDAAIVDNSKVINQDTNNIIQIGDTLGGTQIDVAGTDGERTITGVADGTKAGDAATWDQIAAANQVLYATTDTSIRGNDQAGNVLYDNAGNKLATLSIGTVSQNDTGFVSGGQVWDNDIKTQAYSVKYDGEVGTVTLERNNGEKITISNIRTTLDPDAGEAVSTYTGDSATIQVTTKDGVGTISAVTGDLGATSKTGLATVENVYNYLAPEDGLTYVGKDKTTGENLAALDKQVAANAGDITSLKNMTNVSPEGETVIKNYAKEAVKVAEGDNITVTSVDKDGTTTYTVAAKTGTVGKDQTTLVTGGEVQNAIDKALEDILGDGDGTTGTLSSKANLDASNVGKNVAGADKESGATEAEKNANLNAWGEALGAGKVAADSNQLVTGKTVYDEVRPTKAGTYVSGDQTTAENLAALDTAVANSSSIINKDGDNIYIGKDSEGDTIVVSGPAGKDGVTTYRTITGVADGTDVHDAATFGQIAATNQTLYASDSTTLRSGEGRSYTTAGNVLYDNAGNALATLSLGSVTEGSNGFVSGGQVWANDIADGPYEVVYTGDTTSQTGTVTLKRNNGSEIKITNIRTSVDPDGGTAPSVYTGDGKTIDVSATGVISTKTDAVGADKSTLVTGKDVYDYVTPTNTSGEKVDGTYAKGSKTTGENLYALDTQVKTNADEIEKLKNMEDITPAGETVIQNISKDAAKNAVKVAAGTSGYVTVTDKDDTDGNKTYTVDVKKGSIANGGTGFVDGQDVYNELRPTDGTYVKKDNTTARNLGNLDTAVTQNTSDITNLQNMTNITETGKDQIRDIAQGAVKVAAGTNVTVAEEEKDNVLTYTVSAEGKGVIKASDTALLTGGTAYTYLAPTTGTYVNGTNTTGQNLSALDTEIVKLQNMETVTPAGEKTIREIVSKSVEVTAGDNVTVDKTTDATTGVTTYKVSSIGGEGGSSIVDYDGTDHWLSTDFGNKDTVEHGKDSTAYGYGANAKGDDSVAIGNNALADGKGSIAIGADSVAHTAADGTAEISFGHAKGDTAADGTTYSDDLKRKLTNVEYGTENNDVATVGQTVAGDQEISLATTTKPESGEDTRTNVLKANDGTVLATFTAGAVEKDNTGFISGGDVYSYVTPSAATGETLTYVSADKTTGENLKALDTQVTTNTSDIEKLKNMETISDGGKTVIKDIAKSAVKVSAGDYITVTDEDDKDGNKTYTVSAKIGKLGDGEDADGLVTAKDVKEALAEVGEETGTELAKKANLNADNIGKNLKGSDGTTAATAEEQAANLQAWGEALGTGTVTNGSKELITGGTVYSYVTPTAASGETLTYVGADKTTGENLKALDTQLATNTDTIKEHTDTIKELKDNSITTEAGKTLIKETVLGAFDIQGSKNIGVDVTTDATTGVKTYTISSIGGSGSGGGSSIVDYDAGKKQLSTDFGKTYEKGEGSTAYGYDANAKGEDSVAVGKEAVAESKDSVAIGKGSTATGEGSTVVGSGASATGENSVAIGKDSVATGKDEVSFGGGTREVVDAETGETKTETVYRTLTNVADGVNAHDVTTVGQVTNMIQEKVTEQVGDKMQYITYNNETKTLVNGDGNKATGQNSTVTGTNNTVTGDTINVYGYNNTASGEGSNTYGNNNNVSGKESGAFGNNNTVSGDSSYAIGNKNEISGGNSYALGDNTKVSGSNSVAIGSGSEATEDNVVSFGNDSVKRKLTNIADGTSANDAATYGQLSQVEERVTTVEEAVNSIGSTVNTLDTRLNQGVAGAAALAALHPLDYDPLDKLSFAAGFGRYKSANAFALGAFYRANEKTMFSVGGAFGNGEDVFNAGVSFALGSGSKRKAVKADEMAGVIQNLRQENAELRQRLERVEKLLDWIPELGETPEQQATTVAAPVPTV